MTDPASFRDPSGFITYEGNRVLRVINKTYEKEYEHFMHTGLSESLISKGLLIPHKEITTDKIYSDTQYKVIEAEKIPFISYPYEWCFSQLKDAALLTLHIEELAIEHDMKLKDATAYNIQFHKGKAIFIDTLSFDLAEGNFEWKAYRQFCEFFLAPLCLMAYKDPRLNILLKDFINGIPLDLGVKLLPLKALFKPSVFLHLYLHSKFQDSVKENKSSKPRKIISKEQHKSLIAYLSSFIQSMTLPKLSTEWETYYSETKGEKPTYLTAKEKHVEEFIKSINPDVTWDIGANDGLFSRIASRYSRQVISMDYDWQCIEFSYRECKKNKIENILPLITDLVNPSGGIGWNSEERKPLFSRSEKPGLIIALALMHHIINANVPFSKLIELLSHTKEYVILEFIPKTDPKVELIFHSRGSSWKYIEENEFREIIQAKFQILKTQSIEGSSRILYLLKLK
jgi:hypothetical protein